MRRRFGAVTAAVVLTLVSTAPPEAGQTNTVPGEAEPLHALSARGEASPAAQAPARQAAGENKVIWYFYTVKWGFQDEFMDLFQRNHYPLLKAREKAGQYASVRTFVPEFHGDGRSDWTFAVELVVPPNAPTTPTNEEFIAKMYPDRAKFNREEQRRFEILAAHWDVPLNRVDFDSRKPMK